jgi:GNAT superfamily N-acetyltransferase
MTPIDAVVEPTDIESISELRDAHRSSAGCQIVRDSILPRGLGEPWGIRLDGELVGYAGLWREHFPGRLMEFVLTPAVRGRAPGLFTAVLDATEAEEVECQTNLPLLAEMFREFADEVVTEHLLFEDGGDNPSASIPASSRVRQGGATEGAATWVFRARRGDDTAFAEVVPEGPWVVVEAGHVVGSGGILTHYNPPFGDLYMEVVPQARGRGLGRFLVRRLRGVARGEGLVPAARCDPANEGSRRALVAGGMRQCGVLLSGRISRTYRRGRSNGSR